jgi:hypothetical protein
VTLSSAILYGYVNPHGLIAGYRFQYGPTAAYTAETTPAAAGNGTVAIRLSQSVGGLAPGTVYHYRIVAASSAGTTEGTDLTFKTASVPVKKPVIVPLTVRVASAPDPVVFGDPFTVQGAVAGTGAAGREVALQLNPFPYTAGFKDAGNPEIASAAGTFSFPVVGLLENTQLRVAVVGPAGVYSPVVTEDVAVRVTLHVRPARRRRHVRLYGTVAPAEAGALVGLEWRDRAGNWVVVSGTVVKGAREGISRFGRVVPIGRRRGLYRALVEASDGAHVPGYSPPVLIR